MKRLTFLNGYEIPCVRNDQCFEEQSEHYCGPAINSLAADVAPVVHGRKIEDGDIGCFWL